MRLSTEELFEKFSQGGGHPNEVRRLALMIFDEMSQKVKKMPDFNRQLLSSAALLHDIGYFIESKSHNKHTQQLILEYGLSEFTEFETKQIACICRYHRGSLPDKEKHEIYKDFAKQDRHTVKRLAGILRLADGLDSAHLAIINKIRIEYDKKNEVIEIFLTVNNHAGRPDITSAIRKRDLLEIGFKVQSVLKFE